MPCADFTRAKKVTSCFLYALLRGWALSGVRRADWVEERRGKMLGSEFFVQKNESLESVVADEAISFNKEGGEPSLI
jgi:hypothetical protein